MKKIRALSLALSLVLAPVGNQLYAAESGWTPRPVAQTPAQNFNLPTDDPEVSLASDIFEDMVMSRMDFGNTENLTRKFRASYYLIGSMLGRCGEIEVGLPGGCNLGARPIDQHIKGFEALGAKVEVNQGKISAKASSL